MTKDKTIAVVTNSQNLNRLFIKTPPLSKVLIYFHYKARFLLSSNEILSKVTECLKITCKLLHKFCGILIIEEIIGDDCNAGNLGSQ